MRQNLVIILQTVIILSLVIALVACKGGSSDSPIPASPTPTASPNVTSTQAAISFPNTAEKVTLTINIDPEDGGNTSPFPPGDSVVPLGQVREIKAISSYGYEFFAWDGDVSDMLSPTTSVTINGDMTITAIFKYEGTPQPKPDIPNLCEQDRDAIQDVLDSFYAMNGKWPTSTGQPGDIQWDMLIPEWLDSVPPTDDKCEWQINSDPQGQVCLLTPC
ncbi:MAG: hypothetical protein HQ553_04370 [Chloroflexi bacterium]|nr:hypothetical protein [Chloroflexota bacterium]